MKKRGIGVGSMWYGIANTALPNPAAAFIDLLDDGKVLVMTGCVDIGQGSDTALAQIAAQGIGVPYEDVVCVSTDTNAAPAAGAASASRQTYVGGNAILQAARSIRQQVAEFAAGLLECDPTKIDFQGGLVYLDGKEQEITFAQIVAKATGQGRMFCATGWFNPDTTGLHPETCAGKPYACYAFATQIAQVEVDTETGMIQVLDIVAAHDVGRAINPGIIEGQIEGGCCMGLGYGLMEEVITKKGEIVNPNLHGYIIPTAMDMPKVHPIIVEDLESTGPFGAKGVGEPTLIPTAAAIANAVENAIGIRFYDLPLTPERVLEAIKKHTN